MRDTFVIAVDRYKVEIDEENMAQINEYTITARNFFYEGRHQTFKVRHNNKNNYFSTNIVFSSKTVHM